MWTLALLLLNVLYCHVLIRNSSTHNVSTSCDELLSLPCCSNNEASTSSSTCVVTSHVEEIKELKAQVTSLKKDLEKGHEGKSTLDKVLCGQQSPNEKGGLGFNFHVHQEEGPTSSQEFGQDYLLQVQG